MSKEKTVKSVDLDGKEVVLVVKSPTPQIYRDSQITYNKALRAALEGGAMFRDKLQAYYMDQNIWSDKKEETYQKLLKQIQAGEARLKKGGIPLAEAKQAALDLKKARNEFTALIAERQVFDANSAESQADNARFNYYVTACTFRLNGTRVWDTIEKYDADAEQPWANAVAQELANMLYGLEGDYEKKLVENQFLVKYRFANEDLVLLNKDGHTIDPEGRLINEDGRYVAYDENGDQYFVNIDGERVPESGVEDIEFQPFLDDDGNPILDEPVASSVEVEEVVDVVEVAEDVDNVVEEKTRKKRATKV